MGDVLLTDARRGEQHQRVSDGAAGMPRCRSNALRVGLVSGRLRACSSRDRHAPIFDGRGSYTTEGFVVLKGSRGTRANAPTFSELNQRFRRQLIKGGIMKKAGDEVVFQKDHLFGSPSMAAMALLGRVGADA